MAEPSARGEANPPKSGGKSISTGAGPKNRRERFKSWLKNPINPASLQTPSTSSLKATFSPEKDVVDERNALGPSTTGSSSGKNPEASSGAGCCPSQAQASQSSMPGTGQDCEPVVAIAELWNHAYEQLREREPKLIEKYEAQISLRVSTAVGVTIAISGMGKVQRREQMELILKQKLKEAEDEKWRISFGDHGIAVRDLTRYVVSIVAWGKEYVSTALESSPYGSIAWAGVCLLLPLVLNPSKQEASNLCGLEYISDLLSRCAMYECIYRERYEIKNDRPSYNKLDLATDDYINTLKELYLRTLRFQARSVCQFSRNPVSGGVHAMFKMDDWDALLEDIKLQETKCQPFFDLLKDQEAFDAREEGHRQRTSLLLDKLEDLDLGIKGVRNKLEEIHFSDEETKCFEILRTSNYRARKDLNPEKLSGTCKWFLDHPKYQAWKAPTPPSRLLWVSADPGCGKSVLAKALVDQYDPGSVCYYFFKDDTAITRSAAHALCAILHQICDLRPVLIKHVLPMYRRNGGKLVDLFEELWSAFAYIINDKGFGSIVCILDAIDECSNDDQKKLLQGLAAIATPSTSIRILITSRPYTSIETALFHRTGLDKNEIRLSGEAKAEQSMIEKEIGFFITSKIQEFQKLRQSNEIYDEVHENLQSHLDGVKNRTYLWVSAVFNELQKDVDAPEYILMKTIEALPDNVHKAYENILEKCPKPKKPILINLLHIMLAAFRPLSLMEMDMALSIQNTSSGSKYGGLHSENSFGKWIRDLCGFLVHVVGNDLYFAHQTVREFLLGEENHQATVGWRGWFQLADSHTIIAQLCMDYLLLLYDGPLDATFETYAACNWPAHCQRLEENQSLADKVKMFLFRNSSVAPSYVRWTKDMNDRVNNRSSRYGVLFPENRDLDLHLKKIRPSSTPLLLACNYGWPSVLLVLKNFPDIDWNEKTIYGDTGLQIAAQEGKLEIVRLLLTAGADVNIQDSDKNTPLHLAAWKGHLEIVRLLLTAGADVSIQDYGERTPLHLAASEGHLEIVNLLLMAGADVSIQDYGERTPLHLAAQKGHLEIVKLLLTAGADVSIQDYGERTPLHLAASEGHLEIVNLLLMAGADVSIQDYEKRTPLHLTADEGHLEIVKLLLTAGADVNIQDSEKDTPLHWTASRGHLEIVRLLLTAGADVNIQDSKKDTPMHLAAQNGHLEIGKLLLTAGVDVNIQSSKKDTPLHLAAWEGHLEIVNLLLTAGADVSIQDYGERTPLHLAAQKGHLEIVRLLLTAGADVNIQGSDKDTPLHLAAWGRHLEIVKLLQTAGADVTIQDSEKDTPLHPAARKEHFDTVKLLLTAGADVNIQDSKKNTPLHLAADEEHLEIVGLLLTAGADVNIQDYEERTPLHLAAWDGHLEIVKLLLTAGADVNIQGLGKRTPLHMAAREGHFDIVKLLLTAGADVNIQDSGKDTPLHLAADEEHLEIVRLLLTAGADVNIQDYEERTPLHLAAQKGHLETLGLLLTAGADVNIQDGLHEKTALHLAADKGHLEIVKLLLTAGADVSIQDYGERTPLHLAASEGHLEIVNHLLTAGADVSIQGCEKRTLLHLAVWGGHLEIVNLLLTAGADVSIQDYEERTPLHLAAWDGHLEIVKLLLTAGADVNIQDSKKDTPLHLAARKRHLEIMKLLLTAGADVNIQDSKKDTSLHWTAWGGHLEIVRLLLMAGADVNIQDPKKDTPLHLAAQNGHLEIVRLLLTAGADVNIQGFEKRTPLHPAADKGHLEIVKLLLTAGADVSIQDYEERTPLHLAADKGHLEIVKLLLTAGADVNIQGFEKRTPLHPAADKGHLEIVNLLLPGAG